MKKVLLVIAVTVLVIAIGVGCYFFFCKKDVCKNVIPEDAKAVMVLDAKQLLKEIDISFSDIMKLLKSDKTEGNGIDFLCPMYGFLSNEGYLCGVFALSDADEFEKKITGERLAVESQRGFKWVYVNQILACFNDEKALVLGPISQAESQNMRSKMVEWMSQRSSKSPILSSVLDKDGMLRLRSKMSVVPSSYMQKALKYLNVPYDLDKIFLSAELKVEGKSLCLSTDVESENDDIKGYISNSDDILRPIQGSRLQSVVGDPVVWVGLNTKGSRLLETLRKNSVARLFLIGVNLCMDADMVIKSIDGDVSFELSDISNKKYDYTLKAQVNNKDFLKNAKDWNIGFLGKNSVFKAIDDNTYMIQESNGKSYFGVFDNQMYFSSNQDVSKLTESTASDNFVKKNKSKIADKIFYASISVRKLADFPELQNITRDDKGSMKLFCSNIDRVTVSATDFLHYEVEITTKEKLSDFVKELMK